MSTNQSSSKYPPQLRKFVDRIESEARSAGHDASTSRIYGAWTACYVRYCTLNDRSWQKPDCVPAFLKYLKGRSDVDANTERRARNGLKFVFTSLLKTDLNGHDWAQPKKKSSGPPTLPGYDVSSVPTSTEDAARADRGATSRNGAAGSASGDGASRDVESDARPSEKSSLLTRLLFHTSLPIQEALNLCAGDVDLDAGLIYISDAMGTPKRIVEVPDVLHDPLADHLSEIRADNGPNYVDAALFQANALPGYGESSAPKAPEGELQDDSRESLWSYT